MEDRSHRRPRLRLRSPEGSGSDAEIVPPPPKPPDLPAVETVALASRVKLVGMKACEVQEDDTIIRELGSIGCLGRERKV